MRIAHELASWANSALGVAEGATEMTIAAAKSLARSPGERAAIETAGDFLRAAREAAGITVDELGTAVDLRDPALIEEAEKGKAALPFDLVLRLAGVLGRNDPISFALKLTRSYNPGIWRALDDLGVGKLVVQAGRERDFANLYRANDAARRLSDEDFAHVLKFVGAAFDMAVGFHASQKTRRGKPAGSLGDRLPPANTDSDGIGAFPGTTPDGGRHWPQASRRSFRRRRGSRAARLGSCGQRREWRGVQDRPVLGRRSGRRGGAGVGTAEGKLLTFLKTSSENVSSVVLRRRGPRR